MWIFIQTGEKQKQFVVIFMAVISLYVIRNLFSINGFLSSLEQFFF